MEDFYREVRQYLRMGAMEKLSMNPEKLTLKRLSKAMVKYEDFTKELIPEETPKKIRKYINIPRMIYDLYMEDKILVFQYDADEKEDDAMSFMSDSELSDSDDFMACFVNGVKLLDEYEVREQITANNITGGYWDPKIHWIFDKSRLVQKAESDPVQ